MNIYGLTFSWHKSQHFTQMCHRGLYKNNIKQIVYFDEGDSVDNEIISELTEHGTIVRYKSKEYKGGHRGWPDAMFKLKTYRNLYEEFNIGENDWLLDMDDDTYMCSNKIVSLLSPDKDMIGIQHEPKYETKLGMFGHMSGACIGMRGHYLKKIVNYTEEELQRMQKEHFRAYNLTEMWDLVISYLMFSVGAVPYNITGEVICSADAEEYFKGNCKADFFHFNYQPRTFLEKPCPNTRYDIPIILKKKGLI
jgi:hypothetical protein